ncbi:DUF805 domain-containing protein [Bacteroides sp. OttesenSCG-928-J23]|nr:DUF805 domain-containing protein [Bacteroides sp. OttesenSCG-928-J23]
MRDNGCRHYNLNDEECHHYSLPTNNSGGMFRNPFSFTGRIRRLEYCITGLILAPLSIATEIVVTEPVPYFLINIFLCWVSLAQGTKRCHDRGNSGWFQLIPFYGFVMMFGDGEEGVNCYGTSPKESYEEQVYHQEVNN